MSVGVRTSTSTQFHSFDFLVLSIVFPRNNPTVGKVLMTVSGSFLGNERNTQSARLGGSACESTVWRADTSLLCKTPAGIRGTRIIIATTGERDGTRTEIFSFDNEGLSSASPYNIAATGAQVVTIHGNTFGTEDQTQAVRFGLTASEYTRWISDTAVSALSCAGIRATRRVIITVRQPTIYEMKKANHSTKMC
jgi:hypothetical protein